MIASLLLAAALLAPGAARLPAHYPATAVARVMAVCAARCAAELRHPQSVDVERARRVASCAPSGSRYVPAVVIMQLRR